MTRRQKLGTILENKVYIKNFNDKNLSFYSIFVADTSIFESSQAFFPDQFFQLIKKGRII